MRPPPRTPAERCVVNRIGFDPSRVLLQEIQDAFDDLPADHYAASTRRFRWYARAVAVPWK